jgi:hypothetical protein
VLQKQENPLDLWRVASLCNSNDRKKLHLLFGVVHTIVLSRLCRCWVIFAAWRSRVGAMGDVWLACAKAQKQAVLTFFCSAKELLDSFRCWAIYAVRRGRSGATRTLATDGTLTTGLCWYSCPGGRRSLTCGTSWRRRRYLETRSASESCRCTPWSVTH